MPQEAKILLLDASRSQEHFLPLTYNLASGIFRGNERGHGKGIVEFGRGFFVALVIGQNCTSALIGLLLLINFSNTWHVYAPIDKLFIISENRKAFS